MSTNYIQVKYSDIDNVGEALNAATEQIQAMLQNLEADIAKLKEAWTGAAKAEYDTAEKAWQASVQRMHAILRNSRSTLEDMSYNYRATDLNLAMRWADIG